MKNIFKKVVSSLLATLIIAGASVTSLAAQDVSKVGAFVERCYTVILGRDFDAAGKQYFVDSLLRGDTTGINVAHDFVFSDEYKSKNKTDEDYITDLYSAFLEGRDPDQAGYDYWISVLNSGSSDLDIFNGFATSAEFQTLCRRYGISSGSAIPGSESARNRRPHSEESIQQVGAFVERCFTVILGREADQAGKDYWTEQLLNGTSTGVSVAYGFVFSDEYKNKNRTNEEYIADLYHTFLEGREPDADGYNYWISRMNAGDDDLKIFNGFATSNEFRSCCARYGIVAGDEVPGSANARADRPSRTPQSTVAGAEEQTLTIDTPNGRVTVTGYFDVNRENEIFNQLNSYRQANGVAPLVMTDGLRTAARQRAVEVCYSFSHTRPNGSSCTSLFPDGYHFRGENIAAGRTTASAVMDDWKNSAGHNANMLSPNYVDVGIGCFVCLTGDDAAGINGFPYANYYAQEFGA